MKPPHFRQIQKTLLLCLALALCVPPALVRAQGQAAVTIFEPQLADFPKISVLMDAFDEQGGFLSGLAADNLSVLEDGQLTAPQALEELDAPLSLAVAVNSGLALAVRDGMGFSRYDKLSAVLKNWAAARPASSSDQLALVWNGGILASQVSPADWLTRLQAFDLAARTSTPGFETLAFALDVTQQTPLPPGGKKAILLITPHLDLRTTAALPDLLDRARQANVRVFIWLVDSSAYFQHESSLALQDLALKTGGRFLTFSGMETLPDPEEWIASLRHVYRFTYTSAARESGPHSLSVQLTARDLLLSSNLITYPLELQPPSPTLLSPPFQIVRQNPDAPFDIENFLPKTQVITALIEFTDPVKRDLVRTTLYVDGEMAAENTTAPFDKFTWDVSGYLATGEHSLQIEAVDELGLSQKSVAVPVQVTVIQPPGGLLGLVLRNKVALTMAVIILAGLILIGILFFGGRKTLAMFAELRRRRAMHLDPLTQPVSAMRTSPRAPQSNAFPWLRRKAPPALAYFVRLTPDGQPAPGEPILLTGRELTFGTDPTQASLVLDHASVSPLHARLRKADLTAPFILHDQNSVAGTWVNLEPCPREGSALNHGDIIHFGELTYRFVLAKPPAVPKPIVTPLPTDDPH